MSFPINERIHLKVKGNIMDENVVMYSQFVENENHGEIWSGVAEIIISSAL